MSGGSDRHLAVAQALFTPAVGGGPAAGAVEHGTPTGCCGPSTRVYYPDVFVVCGPRADRLYEDDAALVIEVQSPSTEAIDRREKATAYAGLASMGSLRPRRSGMEAAARRHKRWRRRMVLGALSGHGHRGAAGHRVDLTDVWDEVDELAP